MPKRNVKKYLEEAIETCWASQRAMIDDESQEFQNLDQQVIAYQDIYVFLTGDEYTGESGTVLEDDQDAEEDPSVASEPEPYPPEPDDDDDESEEDEDED